ncbi:MAG TPA: peptidase S8, partial [Albitalea sp.]|nr:peptidase S8 [Albitalea sp.]
NEVESNNTLSTAQAVTQPVTVNGAISNASDTDYFKVNVGAGKTLAAQLSPTPSADYDLYLYNSAGTELKSSIKPGGQVDSVSVSNSGASTVTYVARVRRYSGGNGAYALTLN